MGNPKPKYAISDFEPPQYEPTASATAEDADNEFELQQYEPTAGRHEEDRFPLVNVSDPLSDPYGFSPRNYCVMRKHTAWTTGVLVVIAIIALVTGLAVGLRPKKYSGHLNEWVDQSNFADYICGHDYLIDTTDVVLAHHSFFNASSTGSNRRASTVCGHKLRAKGPGKSLTLTVVDRCNNCDPGDLLVGNGTYDKLIGSWSAPGWDPQQQDGPPPDPRPSVTWHWLHPIPPLPTKQEIDNDMKNYTGKIFTEGPKHGAGACGAPYSIDNFWLNDHATMISLNFLNATSTTSNMSTSPFCGHMLQATGEGGSQNFTVFDHCKDCGPTDLVVDLEEFELLVDTAPEGAPVEWQWLPPVPLT